ncbi:MAG: hypothetical protein ACRCZ2_09655 [Fusobacteriaceae bacterium]
MYLIAKFMGIFNYKFDEVKTMNWFTFNDLLSASEAVKAERDMSELMIADNHLLVNSKDTKQHMKLYKTLEQKIKESGVKHIQKVKSVSEIMKELGGGN